MIAPATAVAKAAPGGLSTFYRFGLAKQRLPMKFTISSTKLLKALGSMNRVIVANPVVPILDHFLFETKEELLTVTATDLQTFVVARLPVQGAEQGKMAVPARILMETLRSLPEQPLTFAFDPQRYSLKLTTAHGHYKVACENATDFPQVPAAPAAAAETVAAATLKRAIAHTLPAASKDELRPLLAGLHINLSGEQATFVATDGHRLARYSCGAQGSRQQLTVPGKPLQLLGQLLESGQGELRYSVDQETIHFETDQLRLITRLLNGDYPDYSNVIPQHNPHTLRVGAAPLLKALKRVAIYSNRTTHEVGFALESEQIKIFAEDRDFSNQAQEELPCSYQGPAMQVGFNAKLLIELLSILGEQEIVLQLDTPAKAVLLIPQQQQAGEQVLLLIMPVLLKEASAQQ